MAYNMEDFAINYPPQGGNPQTAGNWMTSLNDWLGRPQGPMMLGQLGSALVANDPKQWQTGVGNWSADWSKSRIAAQAAAQANEQKQSLMAQLLSGLGDQGAEGPTNFSVSRDPKTGNYLMNVKTTVDPKSVMGEAQSEGAGGGAGGGYPQPTSMQMPRVQQTPALGNMLTGGENYRTYPF